MTAPLRIQTSRLSLRPPDRDDAEAIFARFASDEIVTRFTGWPRHFSIRDTEAFLEFSRSEWEQWRAGPLLIESRATGELLGTSGLACETAYRASTGYVLARDAWGHGYASEALHAVAALAEELHIIRLYALCHVSHVRSIRVLERVGFRPEGVLRSHLLFPNLGAAGPQDVFCYSRIRGLQ
jgi:RimJ/RimL family protein N-acetyltransferase